jgi:hypothetical protein
MIPYLERIMKTVSLFAVAAFSAASFTPQISFAADVPNRKAASVEYVRVCNAQGAGFFFIPGTETCLRISGRVRAEYRYVESFSRAADISGFRARGRLNLDARTSTPYGILRTYFRYELTSNQGSYSAIAPLEFASVDKAFIQFAGLTAGRANSFFDFYDNYYNFAVIRTSNRETAHILAYTADLGSGLAATLSIEDQQGRRVTNTVVPSAINYAGQGMPDVVGALRLDQAWGSAQLSGGLHEVRGVNRVGGAVGNYIEAKYGFALQAGVKFNLPMIAAGDAFWLQATYSDGALAYHGTVPFPPSTLGAVSVQSADAYVDPLGRVKTTKAWALNAAFTHNWTPKLAHTIFGSYFKADYASSVSSVIKPITRTYGVNSVVDHAEVMVGSNLVWNPLNNLFVAGEILYTRLDPKGRIDTNANKSFVGSKNADDSWEGRLRLQRDF